MTLYPADDHARATQRSWRTLDRSIALSSLPADKHRMEVRPVAEQRRFRRHMLAGLDMASAFSVAFGEPET